MNVVSRRGTNQLHGSLFEPRNDKLDARNFFDVTGRSAPNKRNQFGFLVSGPVLIPKLYNGKDRTFFMFSWEWQRQRNGVTSTALVPSAAERLGDFSGTSTPVVDLFTKVPFSAPDLVSEPYGSRRPGLVNLYPESNSADPARNFVNAPCASSITRCRRFSRGSHDLDKEHAVLADNSQSAGRYRTRTGTHQAFKYDAVQSERHVQFDSAIHICSRRPSSTKSTPASFV